MNGKHLKVNTVTELMLVNCQFKFTNNDTIKLNSEQNLLYITSSPQTTERVSRQMQCPIACNVSGSCPVDIAARLLQSTLMQLRGTSRTLGRCLAAYVLKYRCLIKRRILLQDAHEVENGRVLMADESRQTVLPSLAGIVRPLRPVDSGVWTFHTGGGCS